MKRVIGKPNGKLVKRRTGGGWRVKEQKLSSNKHKRTERS